MKGLVIQTSNDPIVAAQYEPLQADRQQLRHRLNLDFEYVRCQSFSDVQAVCASRSADVVFLLPFWDEDAIEVEQNVCSIRESKPSSKLIFVDPFAQTSSRYFSSLPYVDAFLKRQRLQDLNQYYTPLIGGTVFTDFLARHRSYDLNGWSVDSQVPQGFENRITTGWSLGAANRFRKAILNQRFWWSRQPQKDIDVFCRLSLGSRHQQEWYTQYRIEAVEALKPITSDYRLVASAGFSDSGELVSQRQYFDELRRTRIVFSPFGWGESCWRDFEAVCFDCLLVKPSMSHIHTDPNLFIEGETYVPVRWDFSDLTEKISYYLDHPEASDRITKNARKVFTEYFREGGFIKGIERILGS